MFGLNYLEAFAKKVEKIELECQVNRYLHSGPLTSYHLVTEVEMYSEQ